MEPSDIDLDPPAATGRFANWLTGGTLAVALAFPLASTGATSAAAQSEPGRGPAAAAPAPVDADGDGGVSAQEHERAAKLMFQRMDGDGNGRVDAGELDAALTANGRAGAAQVTSQERIRLLDSDGDGLLSQQEHGSGAQRMFVQLDANADGRITAQEHAAARAKVAARAGD
ncbi:MAG: hypothetical protein M3Q40_02405 [Pseudomonadota bacterium]|nr:hypothetical protein [Pseudomonadota bacterium]